MAKFDAGEYTVQAAGANMWAREDAFHFVWKKLSGSAVLTADIAFGEGETPDPHRKAVLIFRQSLDADGVYVDAAQHGSGMTALQYRHERGSDDAGYRVEHRSCHSDCGWRSAGIRSPCL